MPPHDATRYTMAITLHVFVEGHTPYEVKDKWMVSAGVPLGPGMMLPVKVDPDDL